MLQLFTNLPFGPNSQVDLVDTYVGDGVTKTFNLTYKSGTRLGATIQFDALQYNLYNGGFTKNGNSFTLISAPPSGSQGNAAGVSCLTFSCYDQATIPGNSSANVSTAGFVIADITEIQNFYYTAYPGASGIQIAFVDLITAVGLESAWTQLATSGNFGAIGAFLPLGQALFTFNLSAFGQVASSSVAPGINVIVPVTNASAFTANDYVLINPGGLNAEQCRIQAVGSNYLLLDGTNFTHYSGEAVYTNGRLFYGRVTVPVNYFGGQAQTVYELGLQVTAEKVSRL